MSASVENRQELSVMAVLHKMNTYLHILPLFENLYIVNYHYRRFIYNRDNGTFYMKLILKGVES